MIQCFIENSQTSTLPFIFPQVANRLENTAGLFGLLGRRIGDGHFNALLYDPVHLLFDWHELAIHFLCARYCKRFGAIGCWPFVAPMGSEDNRIFSQHCKIIYSCETVKWRLALISQWFCLNFRLSQIGRWIQQRLWAEGVAHLFANTFVSL